MSTQTIIAIIMASIAILGAIGAVLALAFRTGTLNGTILSFMNRAATDRTEVLTEIGKLDGKLDRHIEQHVRGTK